MTDKQKKINYLISTVRDSEIQGTPDWMWVEYLSIMSQVICQFDTDIAIAVMGGIGDDVGKEQAQAIKVNYGY